MKNTLLFGILLLSTTLLHAQNNVVSAFGQPDTIFQETCENFPEMDFLYLPSGNDTSWVNYDADMYAPICRENGPTPGGWYIESDLGQTEYPNDAFTSCSFFKPDPTLSVVNANWLIMKNVHIPNEYCYLTWKSSSYSGPAFLDGYKVLVSSQSNIPEEGHFKDTLFSAAEMLYDKTLQFSSLDLSDYVFSPGYIHADSYTDENYFTEADTYYQGKLEPHMRSLAAYKDKDIFIAFLHDSDNDFLLQLDDIFVIDNIASALPPTPFGLTSFEITPSLASNSITLRWAFDTNTEVTIRVSDMAGRTLNQGAFNNNIQQQTIDINNWSSGTYMVSILTPTGGIATRRFVKI